MSPSEVFTMKLVFDPIGVEVMTFKRTGGGAKLQGGGANLVRTFVRPRVTIY